MEWNKILYLGEYFKSCRVKERGQHTTKVGLEGCILSSANTHIPLVSFNDWYNMSCPSTFLLAIVKTLLFRNFWDTVSVKNINIFFFWGEYFILIIKYACTHRPDCTLTTLKMTWLPYYLNIELLLTCTLFLQSDQSQV